MKTKLNYWRWISFIINIGAIVYLDNLGVNIWIANIIVAVICLSNYFDGLITKTTKTTKHTLNDVFLSKIDEATKLGLVRFTFEYNDQIYLSEWRHAMWNDPILISKL